MIAGSLGVEVLRVTLQRADDARLLLNEYYEEVGIIERDTPAGVHRFLSSADSAFWMAYVGGTPAGCVALRPLDGMPSAGECKRLYVRDRYRRRGIAAALLDALESHARELSLDWIYLDSQDDLKAAIALYLARNYQRCERYNDNVQATVFLKKSLRFRPAERMIV